MDYRRQWLGMTLGLMSATLASADPGDGHQGNSDAAGLNRIDTVVIIYAENRSFDNLFGGFPRANGLRTAAAHSIKQLDRDHATVLATLPPAWGGLTASGQPIVVTQAETTGVWPNGPFQIDTPNAPALYGYPAVSSSIITRDLYHRFFENQMEIDGGKNDQFAAWGDSGGLVMGFFDGAKTKLWDLAQQYTLADNFFEAAFGGSFLNHQYLICACAPIVSGSFVANNKPSINTLGAPLNGVPQLAANTTQAPSALTGAPSLMTGNIAPLNYFGATDGYRAVNTMQPAYQPSGNAPMDAVGNDALYADSTKATTLPPQTQTTIGDLLSAKGISWAWYSGGWAAASANPWVGTGSTAKSTTIYNTNANGTSDASDTDFQSHHQPFNYYARFDPVEHPAARMEHLRDRSDLLSDIANGTLPAVSFYKPVGYQNQHPGYTNVTLGDDEIVSVVEKLRHSPQWHHMLILVTYDEFGGQFDHVAPPKGDLLGPGTRIPALIISPFAKRGYVDHTQYDTASVLRFITRRYDLPVLHGLAERDAALIHNGGKPMGDLTGALNGNDHGDDDQD
jgi:acid phosphatase